MGITLTWLGHSAFSVDIDGHNVLFDPYLTDNPLASTTEDTLTPEIIFLSHAHFDHLGDTEAIALRTGALVVCNWEIGNWLMARDVKAHQQNPGGGHDHGFVHARLTVAFHSSSFADGMYGGEPNGIIVTAKTSGKRLYFAGDTALFSDMSLIGDYGIDVAFLPIGDNFTMGPDDSLKAIKLIRPKFVVPMHYNTWDVIAQDVSMWANRVSNETDALPIVLDPGGTYTLD
jgi:L-ascorbate metabolism protein UlaG (beta-lactamase superfamily)